MINKYHVTNTHNYKKKKTLKIRVEIIMSSSFSVSVILGHIRNSLTREDI